MHTTLFLKSRYKFGPRGGKGVARDLRAYSCRTVVLEAVWSGAMAAYLFQMTTYFILSDALDDHDHDVLNLLPSRDCST